MEETKVSTFLMMNAKYFPNSAIAVVRGKLEQLDDSKLTAISSIDFKEPTTILLVSIFLGSLGIDRFMIGDIGMGILKLLTAGLCGILTIIDWFTISNKVKEDNFRKFMEAVY